MRNERPSDCPAYIEKFVDDYYPDPIKFLPDAIEFSKSTEYKVSFTTEIDEKGKATIETIWFHHKAENNKTWFEYDCKKEILS